MKKFLEFCLVACVSWYGITTGCPAFGGEPEFSLAYTSQKTKVEKLFGMLGDYKSKISSDHKVSQNELKNFNNGYEKFKEEVNTLKKFDTSNRDDNISKYNVEGYNDVIKECNSLIEQVDSMKKSVESMFKANENRSDMQFQIDLLEGKVKELESKVKELNETIEQKDKRIAELVETNRQNSTIEKASPSTSTSKTSGKTTTFKNPAQGKFNPRDGFIFNGSPTVVGNNKKVVTQEIVSTAKTFWSEVAGNPVLEGITLTAEGDWGDHINTDDSGWFKCAFVTLDVLGKKRVAGANNQYEKFVMCNLFILESYMLLESATYHGVDLTNMKEEIAPIAEYCTVCSKILMSLDLEVVTAQFIQAMSK